jgi:hypothetical protein
MAERSWPVPKGEPVALEEPERVLSENINNRLDAILQRVREHAPVKPSEIAEMGALAHELHVRLANRGIEPKHHKYMLANRRVAPNTPEFYRHVHPVEDLLRFLANRNANDDAVDVTIGHEFRFSAYSRRWKHNEEYSPTRTPEGWSFANAGDVISTGRDARVGRKDGSGLFHFLEHNWVSYPHDLPDYFESLWDQSADRGLTQEEVQAALDQLADWVTVCEKHSPGGIFEGIK